MRDDDLARLAEKIALAWAGGDSRAITQKQAVVASVLMTLREINDRRQPQSSGDAQSKAADRRSGRDTSVRLICCPECESIMRDAGALARHRRFCVMGMRKVHLGEG
jgi:hypothetical protein